MVIRTVILTNNLSPSFPVDELSPILTIDLMALSHNYSALQNKSGKAKLATVVKADAYGLGIENIVPVLMDAGCESFFVATACEADALRNLSPDNDIYIMNGLTCDGTFLADKNLAPCLASGEEVAQWITLCNARNTNLPAAIHIDTGFNRLGICPDDWSFIADQIKASNFIPKLIMSHLACSEHKEHPKNRAQVETFEAARQLFPDVTASLANSGGIFLGTDFHYDLIRAGIALYGSVDFDTADAGLKNVLSLHVPILQLRDVKQGETVGYGCDFIAQRDSKIAVLGIGYADGIFRHLGDLNDKPATATVALEGQIMPLIGRVSMDLTTIDVTDFTGSLEKGMMVELIGETIKLADVAQRANSISYEILTRLGTRYKRYYKQYHKTSERP